ncbi:Transcriptional regulator [Streptomyces albidoflavus]|nr:Transcriptional regulator [Streptomyces albidoflavus]SCD59433.1 transcriptional regulator, TetR family [Streptomyces sp. BvitLS-983]BDH49513.1 TetR family transcriptional regulator [Streptomyces albus]AMM07328.1 Transcriptional regulator [Streptomyces albidoflavus]QLP90679.1 Transcriptional regulator [Streptomyces albidoflavus]
MPSDPAPCRYTEAMTSAPDPQAPHAAPSGRPPRRHGADLTRAIHLATLAELADTSLEELSFERIAARAGAGKASLYRRWSTPAGLLLEALTDPVSGFGDPPPQPRTGSLRTDLVRLLGAFADALDRPHGRALRPLLAQRARHPELYAEVYRRVVLPHKEILLGVLGAAVERGEAGPGALGVRTAATAPRLVIAAHMEHGTVPRDEVEALVDEVLMPLFTAGGGGNVPGPEERSTMGA